MEASLIIFPVQSFALLSYYSVGINIVRVRHHHLNDPVHQVLPLPPHQAPHLLPGALVVIIHLRHDLVGEEEFLLSQYPEKHQSQLRFKFVC